MRNLLLIILFLLLATPAYAQRKDSDFLAWSVYHYHQGHQKLCYAYSTPVHFEGKVYYRKPAYFMVLFNPAEERWEVNVSAGFNYRNYNPGSIQIDGGEAFPLFSHATNPLRAWVPTIQTERDVMADLEAGKQDVVVTSFNEDNVPIQDVYALKGFSDALDRVEELCNINTDE